MTTNKRVITDTQYSTVHLACHPPPSLSVITPRSIVRMSATANPFNLKKQLAFYGSYHTDPVNVAIHIVGVPSIIL